MSSSSTTGRTPYQHQVRRGTPGAYRLVRTPPGTVDPPLLDATQRAVVDHDHGPLLVLAGPGTGKTTTLVEAVAARVAKGADPERILVLTFSRKAAVELRDRMALRLGGTKGPQATTFHSFCYALVRAHQDADLFSEPLRLLSGPEQDVAVRELLAGQIDLEADGLARNEWPDELRACLTTRGFADEVRAVLARSRELGLGPDSLARFAARTGRPDWGAAASFLAEYLDVLDMQGVLDYAELVHRAVLLAERLPYGFPYDAVFVDEYQDTDPAQVRLLQALAGRGRTLVAFGDPDQSIYAFRGADVNGILDFPDAFPHADGSPAGVAVLTTSRRSGSKLLDATRLLTRRMPLPRLPSEKVRAHRELGAVREGGRIETYTYPTASTELDNIADILRRAHLEEGVPWGDMAVLVRAGGRTIPSVRRALTSAGVPLDIDGDDVPLRHEPAVTPLLTALRAVAEAAIGRGGAEVAPTAGSPVEAVAAEDASAETSPGRGASADADGPSAAPQVHSVADAEGVAVAGPGASPDGVAADRHEPAPEASASSAPPFRDGQLLGRAEPGSNPDRDTPAQPAGAQPGDPADPARENTTPWLRTETALELLVSPLGGMDTADLRRLGRALRDEERAGGNKIPPPSDELLARALAEPERLVA
ncbi:UvrD-helicase domain-containing protein, partial [Streptomyces sp.]|uniref:UvrD-helicase domain-containing protein n=1 Tax=Streptomyces sp. TaxID=1931 RepID=UPI002D799A33